MRVNIVTGDSIKSKQKYTVENIDSAIEIIKDYAKENNFNYGGLDDIIIPTSTDAPQLIGIIHFFKSTNNITHFEGSAFIWSK